MNFGKVPGRLRVGILGRGWVGGKRPEARVAGWRLVEQGEGCGAGPGVDFLHLSFLQGWSWLLCSEL